MPRQPPEASAAEGVVAPDGEPDYRVSLAAERTYLAYVRTSLALIAAGVAVVGVLPGGNLGLKRAVALILIGFGALVVVEGFRHGRKIDAAVRAGAPLPRSVIGPVIAVAMVLVALLAVLLALSMS